MFDGLNEIPWHELSHAYGDADDVPELLRALHAAPPDPEPDADPLCDLNGNILHQGTIYEATSYAVPFLIEIVADPNCHHRAGTLLLLAGIAEGSAFSYDHERDAYQAVEEGRDVYFRIVENAEEDWHMRILAAGLLTWFQTDQQRVGALLRLLVTQAEDPHEQSALLLLLGHLGEKHSETITLLLNVAQEDDAAQRSCAVAAIHLLKVTPLPDVISEMANELVASEEFDSHVYSAGIYPYFEVNREILFAQLSEENKQAHIVRMIEAVERADVKNATFLVRFVFPEPRNYKPIDPTNTTPLQRRLAAAIAAGIPKGLWFEGRQDLPSLGRDWKNLSIGLPPNAPPPEGPSFTDPDDRSKELDPMDFVVGQRIHNNFYFFGTVVETSPSASGKKVSIVFDEEGQHTFWVKTPGADEDSPFKRSTP